MIYTAPAMDYMLEPVKVRVKNNGNLLMQPVTVIATTILATTSQDSKNVGDLYSGYLCQHNRRTHRSDTCRYTDDSCIEHKCVTTDPYYPLGKVEVQTVNGIATFDRLLHTVQSSLVQRRLRFYTEYNKQMTSVDSNAFRIDCKYGHTTPCMHNHIYT